MSSSVSAQDEPDNEAVSSSDANNPDNVNNVSSSSNTAEDDDGEVSSSSTAASDLKMEVDGRHSGNGISSSADVIEKSTSEADGVFAQPRLPAPFLAPSASSSSKSRSSSKDKGLAAAPTPSSSNQKEKISPGKLEKYNQILSSLDYHPPSNGASCADPRYNLEVLKNGLIVDSVKFLKDDSKGYYVIGRIPGCDILAENPTVSRLHAILQFVQVPSAKEEKDDKNGKDPQESGLYLYDLKSTHGTFINKNQVFPQRYYRVHVGHVLKFGSSQRMYIVNGPTDDEEEESDKSVTELMNEKLQKDLEKKRLEEEERLKRGLGEKGKSSSSSKLPKENIEEEGIDWGMGEDADEGSDMKVNPFAMDYEASDLTLDNPKKTLRSWFDREGHDLEFEMREKGNGQYVCRIPLPLDGPTDAPVYAESEVRAKKKEAVYDAAMKACQILDSHGILRTSNQESRKRKEKKYEDEDFYSSDEDTFLDRTGSIEKKREKRMRLAGKIEEKVETYESLSKKYAELENEIKELKEKVSKSQEMKTRADEGDIDIDDYMKLLKSDVFDIKKLKSRLKEANEEIQRTKKLMDIAKPVELPHYLQKKPESTSTFTSGPPSSPPLQSSEEKEAPPDRPKLEFPSTSSSSPQKPAKRHALVGPMKPPSLASAPPKPQQKLYGLIKPSSLPLLKQSLRPDEDRPAIKLKDDLEDDDDDEANSSSSNDNDFDPDQKGGVEDPQAGSSDAPVPPKKKKRHRYRNQQRNKQKNSSDQKGFDYDDPKYSTWVPPKNQTGDGRTSLNEKLGY